MDNTAELATLLKNFDVTALGDGDPTAGFNLLVSMACTIAQIAPDDGTVVHADGSRARLSTSLMIVGSASSGRVVDEIVTELNRLQNNLATNLEGFLDRMKEAKAAPGPITYPTYRDDNESFELVHATQSEYNSVNADRASSWRKVLNKSPHHPIERIGKHPKFLVSVGGRKDVESQLTRLFPGPPLVHLGLTHPDDLVRYSDVGAALLEGRYPHDDGVRSVKGNILITDPMHTLAAAAQNPDERTRWLGQVLWLADGDHGPELPLVELGSVQVVGAKTKQRFRGALDLMILQRLKLSEMKPLAIPVHDRKTMIRWSTFLREMEPRLPGISGAARNLLTVLQLGLRLLTPRPAEITPAGIEAMARFLIRRMVNTRIAILHAGDLARKRDQITRIFHKLSNGPANARKLCRDLKITAGERDEVLRWLETASLVVQRGDGWQLRDGARLSFKDCAVPILEV